MEEKEKTPAFFYDESNSDKSEEVIDYFISWTLRCAQSKFEKLGLVHTYAKRIVSELLFEDYLKLENVKIDEVKVWKQDSRIDIWVHVILNDGRKYAIIIENKLYAYLEPHQLPTYKKIGENHYSEKSDFDVKYIFLRCDDDFQKENDIRAGDKKQCEMHGFRPILLWDLKEAMHADGKVTDNDLFDEFWFNWWDSKRRSVK